MNFLLTVGNTSEVWFHMAYRKFQISLNLFQLTDENIHWLLSNLRFIVQNLGQNLSYFTT